MRNMATPSETSPMTASSLPGTSSCISDSANAQHSRRKSLYYFYYSCTCIYTSSLLLLLNCPVGNAAGTSLPGTSVSASQHPRRMSQCCLMIMHVYYSTTAAVYSMLIAVVNCSV